MSGGKKKYYKKRTYTEGELAYITRQRADEAVKKILLLCVTAARDEFDMDEEQFVNFMCRMQRYVDSEAKGLVDIGVANESLKKHGVDLRLTKW